MGGVRNGVQLDPVSYLMAALQDRFAALDEETRLASMTEMLAFARGPGESINALLSRYEIVRMRAATEGQFVMSVEGCALQLLRACSIHPQQLFQTLQPFGGMMPATEAQLSQLVQQLRRHGHLTEGVHGNIGTILHGPMRQARSGAYLAGDSGSQQQEGVTPNAADAQHAYWGHAAGRRTSPASWDVAASSTTDWAASGGGHPEAGYPGWASGSTAPQGNVIAYPTEAEEYYIGDDDDEDSSATSSDSGNEAIPEIPGLEQLSQAEAAEHIYLQFRRAKRTWRRFTGRPVRKFRNNFKFHKRSKGKGKGKGKGKSHGRFMWTHDDTLAYLKGKGKGKRAHTSGKGFGRRGNPRDRNGEIMKCHNCGSEEHLAARCPQKGVGKGSKGKDRGIDFTGFAIQGEGGHAETPEDAGRTFGLPPPWSPHHNSYMNYDIEGQGQEMPDPWQNSTADQMHRQTRHMRRQSRVEAMADGRANYCGLSGFPALPGYGQDLYGADDELSQPSSGHGPRPLEGPDLRPTPALSSDPNFSRDAIASLIRGYRPEAAPFAAPTSEEPPWRPATVSEHTSLFAPAEATQQLRRADLQRVAQVQEATAMDSRQREGEPSELAFMRQVLPLQSLSERAALPAERLMQPAHPAGSPGLTESIPPIENSVSADRANDSLTNIRNAIAVANLPRTGQQQQAGHTQMRFLPVPALAGLADDVEAALQQGTSAASAISTLIVQAMYLQRMANDARLALDALAETQPELAAVMQTLARRGLIATVAQIFDDHAPAPAAMPTSDVREDPPPVFYDEAGQCSICHEDFADGESVCRLRCRHMFHSACWEPVMRIAGTPNTAAGGHSRFRDDCPNCRGPGTIIAVWNYIDPELLTQLNYSGDYWIAKALLPGVPLEEPPAAPALAAGEGGHPEPGVPPGVPLKEPPSYFGITPPSSSASTPRTARSPSSAPASSSSYPVVDKDTVAPTYHAVPRPSNGRPALLVDLSAEGDLCEESCAQPFADAAKEVGKIPTHPKLSRKLNAQGVGNVSQSFEHDLALPISTRTVESDKVMSGMFVTPAPSGSDMPGLTAPATNRATLNSNTMQLPLSDPGDDKYYEPYYKLKKLPPPGTDSMQQNNAPSGHSVLPCGEYDGAASSSTPAVSPQAKQLSAKARPLINLRQAPAYPLRGLPAPPPGLDS